MALKGMTLIDGSWWTGGNRHRGIGKYLAYFFEYVFPIKAANRVWLLPVAIPAREIAAFQARFGGRVELITPTTTAEQLTELIERYQIASVLFSSPFERPWSLLDHNALLTKKKLYRQAIVFDLLPLQFQRKILQTWPQTEQVTYRHRLEQLPLLDAYWAISPQTARSLAGLLQIEGKKISILKFGLTTAWLRPPIKGETKITTNSNKKVALTISGGEWRKNLMGTLAYFAQELHSSHELSVICRLSLRENLRFRRQALELDVYQAVHFWGEVSERDKWRHLYSTDVFLFLSLAEGLGIPLLEARAAGIPRIIISRELREQGFAKLVPGCEVAKTKKLLPE